MAQPPVFLVADGMGGYEAGDVASQVVVDVFGSLSGQAAVSPAQVHERFQVATKEMQSMLQTANHAGSTVAGAAVVNQDGADYWLIFNIGDSRVYSWHDQMLEQISVDHSVVQELLEAGVIDDAQAAEHPQRHQVTRAVATHVAPDPDYWLIPSENAHRILICSDGLTTEVADIDIAQTLQRCGNAQEAADTLVASAVAAGGRDNVSVVVVDLLPTDDTASSVAQRSNGTASYEHAPWDEQLEGTTIPRRAGRKS